MSVVTYTRNNGRIPRWVYHEADRALGERGYPEKDGARRGAERSEQRRRSRGDENDETGERPRRFTEGRRRARQRNKRKETMETKCINARRKYRSGQLPSSWICDYIIYGTRAPRLLARQPLQWRLHPHEPRVKPCSVSSSLFDNWFLYTFPS